MQQREIKFRAWSWKDKLMLTTFDMLGNGVFVSAVGKLIRHYPWDGIPALAPVDWSNDLQLMQFTGLRDKNGKEIYEGDVVCADRYSAPNFVVLFHKGSFHLSDELNRIMNRVTSGLEVIGNIYENPELLTPAESETTAG